MSASDLTLDSLLGVALEMETSPEHAIALRRLRRGLLELSLSAETRPAGGVVHISFECTIREFLLLGMTAVLPGHLRDAVLRDRPGLRGEEEEVDSRLHGLVVEFERELALVERISRGI